MTGTMTPQARNQAIGESDPGRRTAVDFLRVLAERKWLILGVVLACVAASLAISLTSEKEYKAESELLLRDPGFARTLFGSDLFEGGVDPERVTSTKIAVIGSPAVTQRVQDVISERFPDTDVEGAIDVTPNENSDVVTIEATADTPAKAAAIANAYAAEYVAYQRDLDRAKVQDAQHAGAGEPRRPSARRAPRSARAWRRAWSSCRCSRRCRPATRTSWRAPPARTAPRRPSRCATACSPASSACCWASAPPCSRTSWTGG